VKILFVCTGNICRSPMAAGILKDKMKKRNLPVTVESAGLEEFHIGDPADKRAILTMQKRGLDITGHRARLFTQDDFDRFDRIYIMDSYHHYSLSTQSRNEKDMEKVDYIMNSIEAGKNLPVPDPWYDGMEAFEATFGLLERACEKIAESLSIST
jgi:protein-tyrosine phosphatase